MGLMRGIKERRFDHLYRETYYLGPDYVIALQEGVRHRTEFSARALRSLEATLLKLGYVCVRV